MFPGEEEESLVPDNGSAKVGPILILVQRGLSQIVVVAEPIVRIKIRVAQVLICVPVKCIRAALGEDFNNAASKSTEFRAHVAGGNAKFLNGILCGNKRVNIVLGNILFLAVDKEDALSTKTTANLVIVVGNRLRLPVALIGHGAALRSRLPAPPRG